MSLNYQHEDIDDDVTRIGVLSVVHGTADATLYELQDYGKHWIPDSVHTFEEEEEAVYVATWFYEKEIA